MEDGFHLWNMYAPAIGATKDRAQPTVKMEDLEPTTSINSEIHV